MGTYIAGLMRRPITLTDFIDFGKPDWQDWLMSQNVGKHNPGCGDYYLFSKGFFDAFKLLLTRFIGGVYI